LQAKTETIVGIFILASLSVFVYMGFQIGAFRFDRNNYNEYIIYFKDVSGLSRKAEVKIAGVKIGWVEKIDLIRDEQIKAQATVMVLKNYHLYQDAHAIVRQEGLLGPKYLELIPGDSLLAQLESGSILNKPSSAPVSVDEILHQVKKIVLNVQDVTTSFKDAIGGIEGREQLRAIFENLDVTAQKMASFSNLIDQTFVQNEDNLNNFFEIGNHVARLSNQLESNILPTFQEGIEKISTAFDRDFNRLANQIELSASAFEEASTQARDGFKNLSAVATKIDEGKGLIGKLINDEETYRDLKVAVQGIRNYFAKVETMQIIFDSHVEAMQRPAEYYRFEDSKGYFDIRIYPTEDKFYLLQLAVSEKGYFDRFEVRKKYSDEKGNIIDTSKLHLSDDNKLESVFTAKREVITRNTLRFGLQFGKIFGDIAIRFGLLEGFAGLGVDFNVPLHNDKVRWITSVEIFDLRGWNRIDDRRPHLKWINRMFFLDSLYFTFGADDFVSKNNANAFFGAGIRFCDDDVKFLLSSAASMLPNLHGGATTVLAAKA
jgi:phospholipid/cholesterol/gamma-HCH transport system substrate-binding protein